MELQRATQPRLFCFNVQRPDLAWLLKGHRNQGKATSPLAGDAGNSSHVAQTFVAGAKVTGTKKKGPDWPKDGGDKCYSLTEDSDSTNSDQSSSETGASISSESVSFSSPAESTVRQRQQESKAWAPIRDGVELSVQSRNTLKWDYSGTNLMSTAEAHILEAQAKAEKRADAPVCSLVLSIGTRNTDSEMLQSIYDSIKEVQTETRAESRRARMATTRLQGTVRKVVKSCIEIEGKLSTMEERTMAVEADIVALREQTTAHNGQLTDNMWKLEDQENRQRRNNLRFLGIGEGAEGNDIRAYMIKILRDAFPELTNWDWESEDLGRVSGRRSPGPPRSSTEFNRTTCPATISPVSTGVHTRARCPLFTPLLRCVSGPRAPPQVKRPRGLPPGHPVTSASLCSVTLSLTALLRPRSFLGHRPGPRIAPLRRPTERIFSWATGPQPASPPQQEDSSGVPRYSQAPEPPRPAAQREATTSIAGRPPYSPGAARLQGRRLAAPRLGATSPGLPGPLRHLRHRWRTRPESPIAPSRPPSRRFRSRPHARPRLRPRAQASGPQSLRRVDSGTLRGRHGGPPTFGPFRRLRPTAWTSIGPGKVRFRTLSRRPLRSEKFRRAPSPGPWPRPQNLSVLFMCNKVI
ncbi:hypothetical protein NDU88_003675 [Pleurodeles waltl]|uniref:Uncharacterized protein n=1 Tax=Pleurodeles waltl TaxID=8319 RepID=A0AAV7V0P5_PLEWA|nr:hypothetical protein NDU88_003675 [Pleurodeles waltl]